MNTLSNSTCINFESWFYFLTPKNYSPWSKRKIWPNSKRNKISETRKATPTKIGFHAFHINLYLPEIFDLILFFDPHYSLWSEGKIWPFLKTDKKGQNLQKRRGHAHQSWFPCNSHRPLLASIFWANSIFWSPWTVHSLKGKFGHFKDRQKGAKSPQPKRPHTSNLCTPYCLHD